MDWDELTIEVDEQQCVTAKYYGQQVKVCDQKKQVHSVFCLPSEVTNEQTLIILFQDGTVNARDHFYHDQYLQRLVDKQMVTWQEKINTINDEQVKHAMQNVYNSAQLLKDQMQDKTELTTLINKIITAIDCKNEQKPIDDLVEFVKTFQHSQHLNGIIWSIIGMVTTLALAVMAALFFAGVFVTGTGAMIVGAITAAAGVATLITDALVIKDTYRIGRFRRQLADLIILWEDKQIYQPQGKVSPTMMASSCQST